MAATKRTTTIRTTKFTSIRALECIIGSIAETGDMAPSRPRDTLLNRVGGSNWIWTMNRIPDMQESEIVTRRGDMKTGIRIETGEIEIGEIKTGSNGFRR